MPHDLPLRPSRSRLATTAIALLAIAILVPASAAIAQDATPAPAAEDAAGTIVGVEPVVLYDGGDDGTTSLVPLVDTAEGRALPKLSDIVVTYHGFGPSGRAAFEYAVGIWERLVRSPVPIRIDATWTSLPSGALGSAGSNGIVRDFPGAPRAATYYPLALANAKAGRDLYPTRSDIVANFNKDAEWNYSTDGAADGNTDLVSVVLHEIGHGLGMNASFSVSGGIGTYGVSGDLPTIYDRYLADSNGASLLSGNGTSYLGSRLQSNGVRFSGGQAVSENGGTVRIYSPSPFRQGSSMSHLDEDTYPRGDLNSLMTPFIARGEQIRDPGNTALGILRDLGWGTTSSRFTKPSAPTIARVSAGDRRIDLAWTKPTSPERGRIYQYIVYVYENGSSTASADYPVNGAVTTLRVNGLTNGTTYRFRVAAENIAGVGPGSSTSPGAKPLVLGPFDNTDSFLNRQYLDILYRGPSSATLASRRTALNTGADTPGETVVSLMGDATHTKSVPPTIRLYLAYFKRLPDPGGLAYWAGKARGGTSLHKASEQFARSSEFTRAYGSLSNGAFVDLVYQNVLGRSPDSSGRAYWVGKLGNGFARGSMMISVSESSENVRKTANKVAVVGLYHALLRTVPSTTALDAALARLGSGTSLATIAGEILLGKDYAARITGTAAQPIALTTGVQQPVDNPTDIEAADLNGDGRQDLAMIASTPSGSGNAVTVMLGSSTGLAAPVTRSGFDYDDLKSIDTGDVNHDGRADVVVGTNDGIRYFPGATSGAIGPVVTVSGTDKVDGLRTIAVGDVTGDGLDDIVGAGWTGNTLSTWRQLSAGGFAAPTTTAFPHQSVPRMEVTDVSGDGRGDVVALADTFYPAGTKVDPAVSVFIQKTDGTLEPPTAYGLGAAANLTGFAIADVTGDGETDIVAGVQPQVPTHLRILANDGDGTFTAQAPRTTQSISVDLTAADLDGDGRQDLVALSGESPQIDVYRQTAAGALAAALVIRVASGASHGLGKGVVALDLNGDGRLDLATLQSINGGQLWTYLQR